MNRNRILGATLSALLTLGAQAQAPVLTVKADAVRGTIQPTMWGIFFEDINMGADGGVYAELVKNRSFEFSTPLMGWKEVKKDGGSGSLLLVNRGQQQASNPRFLKLVAGETGAYGIANEGFKGMGIRKDKGYRFSVLARRPAGSRVTLVAELVGEKGERLGAATLTPDAPDWKQYEAEITATGTDGKARLQLWAQGGGAVDLDMISLFPKDTWKGRPGGMRADLVQLLADLKPGFLRFPGGCIVEGRELATRYQWKKTVGPVEEREMIVNRWNTEFRHRPAPDYFQTFGLGFFEYFQLSEDIGAEPLPILSCGMACQFNTGEVVPMEDLGTYIQDALDLIEFANGGPETKWGALRVQMGHPAPFNMKFLGVGNEQWGPQYVERYQAFHKVLKAKHPEIRLITTTGPSPSGELFQYLNDTLRKMDADIIDEHYYAAPDWFLQNATRYDRYDRKGPKIFAGEYAVQTAGIASPDNRNNWKSALSEAAYMTGLERNADVVHMASYAPLFAHAEGWQWTPDLIWFNSLQSYATPNYYVQQLFSTNKGTRLLSVQQNGSDLTGQDSLYASAVLDDATGELVLKVVNVSGTEKRTGLKLQGVRKPGSARITVLKSGNLSAENSFSDPGQLRPVTTAFSLNDKVQTWAPYSVSVVRIKVR
ncbi:MAG TPA: alpha-L-arabinofuranosidase C-terminal domain-containing protein [Chitinophagaceae bacterium]|jgi:alpha-L-arabinofuranosidase|nr:alpha-L-arabinofuranosidase C-terminal domain-containing protein [Chitinophagaceae bacterium]